MVRIVRRREPEEAAAWHTTLEWRRHLRRRPPEDLVDGLDKITTRYRSRFDKTALIGEIQGTGFVDGVLTDLDPREWFGKGRSRIDFIGRRMIRADGKEASGVLFTVGAEDDLTPIEALARLIAPRDWRFLGMLAQTVLGRLGRIAFDLDTGDRSQV